MMVIDFSLVSIVRILVADIEFRLGELQLPEPAELVGQVVDWLEL